MQSATDGVLGESVGSEATSSRSSTFSATGGILMEEAEGVHVKGCRKSDPSEAMSPS